MRWAPLLLLAACSSPTTSRLVPARPAPAPRHLDRPVRPQLDGRAFPPGVLALTWDDGPGLHTVALAEYLHAERVRATFFVVHDWDKKKSSDPGFGAHVYDTGYEKLPLLATLAKLGHRVGNHTMHHALLGHASVDAIRHELGDAQRAIDPFISDELRLFRVPGGDWTASASRAVDGDPYLATLVGPVRWDIDGKDWEDSVYCSEGAVPSRDCGLDDGRVHVRVDVAARWYEDAVTRAGRGIVLMHDRVGDVGSTFALDLAHRLIPWLKERGYVFSAPVLRFGAPSGRWLPGACAELRAGDVDGDGRADACVLDGRRVVCARSVSRDDGGLARAMFDDGARAVVPLPAGASSFFLADVSGDRRADLCARAPLGLSCALARDGGFGAFEPWPARVSGNLAFGDLDGDGRADVCAASPEGIVCARSTGAGFEQTRAWLATKLTGPIALGDLDGDGRADVCVRRAGAVACALSDGKNFGPLARWSKDALGEGPLTLADVTGDGRADVCARSAAGIVCALSNGSRLTASSTWMSERAPSDARWGGPALGDLQGDGRADLCRCEGSAVVCGAAP